MTWLVLYMAAAGLSGALSHRFSWHWQFHIVGAPLLMLDCVGNLLIGGSFRNTLSGEAWHHRDHKYWGWTHRFIDALFWFQPNHCRIQSEREARYGPVWAAWWAVICLK